MALVSERGWNGQLCVPFGPDCVLYDYIVVCDCKALDLLSEVVPSSLMFLYSGYLLAYARKSLPCPTPIQIPVKRFIAVLLAEETRRG